MSIHPLAGKPPPEDLLVHVPRLVTSYHALQPDPEDPAHAVAFGTSGHRGSSLRHSFNEAHVLAIAQAVCEVRAADGTSGPLLLGYDTHALSEPAFVTTLEVLAGNGVEVLVQDGGAAGRGLRRSGATPTPVISHAILAHNRGRGAGLADGILLTPSHNPPEDGGFKYNPPSGGPADTGVTGRIEKRANELLRGGLSGVRRLPFERALAAATTHRHDFVMPYIDDLASVLDMEAIARCGLRIGVDPMGGSAIDYWEPVAERYRLDLVTTSRTLDPTFAFMRLDRDGRIRMDCSSPFAMAGLVAMKDDFAIAFGNDTDTDRHGIVTASGGLMNPNHYLAVAIAWLFANRPGWSPNAVVGKTLVSSSMIDRVAAGLGRRVEEVPVGFKWFVPGLLAGTTAFGGEESAGASFLRRDGAVWTTDKDGILLGLLAAEITAVSGRDPSAHYRELEERFGSPVYERLDAPITPAGKKKLAALSPADVRATTLAGQPITAILTKAPGNDAPIGGLKVTTQDGWFAARPSGTEDVYKIYAESFLGPDHLAAIQREAADLVASALA